MILNDTVMSNTDKDDIRKPMRYALDVSKVELKYKKKQDDECGIILLTRGLDGIPQHNHQILILVIIVLDNQDKSWTMW